METVDVGARRKRDLIHDRARVASDKTVAAGKSAVRFVNTAAKKTVSKVGDGLSSEGLKSGLVRMGNIGDGLSSEGLKSGLSRMGDVTINASAGVVGATIGVVGATVSGTRTGLTSTVNATVGVVNLGMSATMEGAGFVAGGVDKLFGREKLDHALLELDESTWHSWSRATAARLEAGESLDDDDLDFRDMARLEKLKARAIEWEQQGNAEDHAASEALTWLADLPHDPLDCSAADFDELTEELARLSLRLQHDTVDMCNANWNDFKKGLENVEALEQELISARFVCVKGRESLGRARMQLEESNVAAQFRNKQVLQEVCVVMSQLKEAVDREDRAREVRLDIHTHTPAHQYTDTRTHALTETNQHVHVNNHGHT